METKAHTEAQRQNAARKRSRRRAPATTRTRIHNGDEWEPTSAAWYATVARLTEETQRMIFAMWQAGRDACEIGRAVGEPATLVQSLIDRGVISPKRVDPYRCPNCRNKVVTLPCFICETKRIHANSRKLREVNA